MQCNAAALSALSSLYTDIVTNGIIGIKGMSIDQLLLPIDSVSVAVSLHF